MCFLCIFQKCIPILTCHQNTVTIPFRARWKPRSPHTINILGKSLAPMLMSLKMHVCNLYRSQTFEFRIPRHPAVGFARIQPQTLKTTPSCHGKTTSRSYNHLQYIQRASVSTSALPTDHGSHQKDHRKPKLRR